MTLLSPGRHKKQNREETGSENKDCWVLLCGEDWGYLTEAGDSQVAVPCPLQHF